MQEIYFIDRSTGNKVREKVPGEKWLRWLYHNPVGRIGLDAVVKRKLLSSVYGWLMDSPDSKARIECFVKCLDIDMDEAVRPIRDYKSFNDFFIRELMPQARPVDLRREAVVSPADGKVMAFEGFKGLDTFFAKGQEFSLAKFLQDQTLVDKYADGTLMIIRLAPVDYHRFHFPAEGRPTISRLINGDYYSVSPHAVKDMLEVYWENKREYCELRTEVAGDILLCEVGATMVGSIRQTYTPDTRVGKGQQKGWFKFGGSTVVMLFEKGKVRVDEDIIRNTISGYETSVKMGEGVALAL